MVWETARDPQRLCVTTKSLYKKGVHALRLWVPASLPCTCICVRVTQKGTPQPRVRNRGAVQPALAGARARLRPSFLEGLPCSLRRGCCAPPWHQLSEKAPPCGVWSLHSAFPDKPSIHGGERSLSPAAHGSCEDVNTPGKIALGH